MFLVESGFEMTLHGLIDFLDKERFNAVTGYNFDTILEKLSVLSWSFKDKRGVSVSLDRCSH